jgi:anti-anti-sigma regulatory factor
MLEVSRTPGPDHDVLVVVGEVDMANADRLRDGETWERSVAIDLRAVGYIDSYGVRALLALIDEVEDAGHSCVLIAPPGSAAELTVRVAGVEPARVAATEQEAAGRLRG